ncbi:ATP-dependent DNA helicase [Pseudactinotalea terrae]|uniref:ATP-dependent DNA helicase n=1 Tax=Pseudactinotalea terrae TaxID=1743262 RepID=UPI0012E15E6D|nr:ATP-dependent DNA helicase [Pseudactinotalea terrae]
MNDAVEQEIAWSAARIAEVTGQPPPTPEQAAVIEAPLSPMLVVAGAGSGKTATMASRVVYLLANALVEPGEVLGLTFTRKAAAELADRVRRRIREVRAAGAEIDVEERPRIATYNSYAGAIVRDHALRLGFPPDATHIGDAGRFQLADEIVTSWAGDIETGYKASTLVDGVTALEAELNEHGVDPATARQEMDAVAEAIEELQPTKSSDAFRAAAALRTRAQLMDLVSAFIERKHERGLIDFGEEVRLAARIAAEVPEVGRAERGRYRVVLLDEYQDTSIAQVALLSALFRGGHPVTAVGDPHQAIYGWRGAAAGTLFDFPATFHHASGEPAATATLSTAWRNDAAVLDAANTVAAPLRAQAAGDVPVLQTREGAGPGRVIARFLETIPAEAEAVADHLQRVRAAGEPPSAAVLCRKRSQFAPIAAALEARGIPVQVVGLAGLLHTPEVTDIWSALIVVHDPGRGDALMRLLTGPSVDLGASDLLALGEWASAQARTRRRTDRREDDLPEAEAPAVREPAELASIVEAIDQLPPPGWRDPRGRELTGAARSRLARLAGALRALRSLSYLSLPELVTTAEHVLGLDIEVAAQRPGPVGEARRNLDELTAVASRFSGDAEDRSLGAFLAWLDAALEEERGLDVAEAEPDPSAVQLMTVHASKGLEWDVVVVPGLVEGTFPTTAPTKAGARKGSGWLSGASTLPYVLRGDRAHLPELELELATTAKELGAVIDDFKEREGARELTEERRLAYVALTRARQELLLLGSFWRDGKSLATASLFLTELIDAGVVEVGPDWPERPAHESNPTHDQVISAPWPAPPSADRLAGLAEVSPLQDETTRRWWHDAELLLAERDSSLAVGAATPVHLSASAIVSLGADRERFLRDRRRPIPRRPSVAARRGTRFHAWVEQHFGTQALLDTDELPGADDAEMGAEPELDALIAAFLASEWAHRVPVMVEADVDTPIAGMTVRCRIDAVFDDGPDRYHVVDWKTGPPPSDPDDLRAKRLQLVLYRLAWARYREVPLENVRASFHHVAANVTIEADDADPSQVTEVLEELTAGRVSP